MKLLLSSILSIILVFGVTEVYAETEDYESDEKNNVNEEKTVYAGVPVGYKIMSLIDWNLGEIGEEDEGDPLLFSLTDEPVKTIRNWSEQHTSFLTKFDLYDVGHPIVLSRTLGDETFTLFLDLDGDRSLSDGTEWMFDQKEDVFQIMARPLIDSNQNGWFDYSDNLWPIAMAKVGNNYHNVNDLGIIGFNWSYAKHFGYDRVGIGQYSDCLYEGISRYDVCTPVSTEHFRIQAYNQNGILFEGGEASPTFGAVMGRLGN